MRNLKKVIALVAVFAMLVSTVAFAQSYTDVASSDNYYEAIEMLSSLNILTGDKDAEGNAVFRPEDTITRAEVATIVERIQNINNAAQVATQFTDVPSSHWASGYVAQAAAQGIINGYGDGTFGPEDEVLYEQAVKMLVETLGYSPFVKDNGGYYAGHILAAQRYGILDGVIGGTPGAKATRGQVAQMVYNAIDTPLMDRSTYGANAEYVIYDGVVASPYQSLLTRDLGVKKFSGIVTGNMWTTLDRAKAFDTSDVEQVTIAAEMNDNYKNYSVNDINGIGYVQNGVPADVTVNANGADVSGLIGKSVDVYVQKNGIDYDVISIAENSRNKTVSFTIDAFDKAGADYIAYYKNEADRTSTQVKIQGDAPIIYNGVAYDDGSSAWTDLFGDLVKKNSAWSGNVTLIDADTTNGYETILVDIAAIGVVDTVSSNGRVSLLNSAEEILGDAVKLYVDNGDTTQYVALTKNGAEIAGADLKKWDVLEIYWNPASSYYNINVVDANKIEGTISERVVSETSAYSANGSTDPSVNGTKYAFKIEGTQYDVAANAYCNGKVQPGSAGTFYIDGNGKIIAYDKNGAVNTVSDKYAYILAADSDSDALNGNYVDLIILDKSGSAYTTSFASQVKIDNASAALQAAVGRTNEDEFRLSLKEIVDGDALVDALVNQLVTYTADANGDISGLVFAQSAKEDDGTLYLNSKTNDNKAAATYNEEEKTIKFDGNDSLRGYTTDVADDTIVFYIRGNNTIAGVGDATNFADKSMSKVGTIATLAAGNYQAAAYDDVDSTSPAVLVIYNTVGGVSPANNVAVIDSTGDTVYDGSSAKSVTYFYKGAKYTSIIDPNCKDNDVSALESASRGDIYRLAISDDASMITGVVKVADYTRYASAFAADNAGEALLTYTDTTNVTFGPVYEYNSATKRVRLAKGSAGAWDFSGYSENSIKVGDANVYVVDPTLNKDQLYVGDIADVNYDQDLFNLAGKTVAQASGNKTEIVSAGEAAYGMMDFVAAVAYDGDTLDIVIYKAYDFGRYKIQ